MRKLKPCPNCGSSDIVEEGNPTSPDSPILCEECGEEQTREEWQANTVREDTLQSKVDALVELVEAQDTLFCFLANEGNTNPKHEAAVIAARAKCRELGLEV